MTLNFIKSNQSCGGEITNIDLKKDLSEKQILEIRELWLEHHVLSFPNQSLNDDDLERFTLCFGSFGDDPFIAPIAGRKNIIAVKRTAVKKLLFSQTIGIRTGVFKKTHQLVLAYLVILFQIKVVILYSLISIWH